MQTARNTALSLIALAALTIYILACTSFSPDDKKILYPAFHSSGNIGVAIYDRDTRQSDLLFVPFHFAGGTNESGASPALLRAQWLPDGRNVLVAFASEGASEELDLTVLPTEGRGPVRSFRIAAMKDPGVSLVTPLATSGDRLYLKSRSDTIDRLDLRTGQITTHKVEEHFSDLTLYPAPQGHGLFYVVSTNNAIEFGRLDPDEFTFTHLATITNQMPDGGFLAYNQAGTQVAFLEKDGDTLRCALMEKGKVRFSRTLPSKQPLKFGNAILSPKGDRVWAAFTRESGKTNRIACGVMEIPLSQAPVREKVLIPDIPSGDETEALYWQVGISHDGKTAAISSTYLAASAEDFKPEDSALFIVDMNTSDWKVTKVPISLPAMRTRPVSK